MNNAVLLALNLLFDRPQRKTSRTAFEIGAMVARIRPQGEYKPATSRIEALPGMA